MTELRAGSFQAEWAVMFSSGFGFQTEAKVQQLRQWVLGCVVLPGLMFAAPGLAQTDAALNAPVLFSRAAALPVSPTPASASITGIITDRSEAAIPGATVSLEAEGSQARQSATAAEDGTFMFGALPPGDYELTVAREGFQDWHGHAVVGSAEHLAMPGIALAISPTASAVEVRASTHEIAEAQLGLEEKQRVLGVFPNFYASYAPNAEPLSVGEKFRLAWRFSMDPAAFGVAGVVAGSEQRAHTFASYGQGASGLAKRYGAAYTDGLTSTMLGQAIFPAIFHQDPRYFVKGSGTVSSRFLYAVASMVICKGDDRRWQMNYSNVLGNFASAAISNVYYPAANRGASLVVQNAMTATAMGALGGLFQEFLLHRMTPNVPNYEAVH